MGGGIWTKEDLKYLAENYGKVPIEDIAKKLDRTICALMGKTRFLGLGQSVNKGRVFQCVCKNCLNKFESKNFIKKYCSEKCRKEFFKKYRKEKNKVYKNNLSDKRKAEINKNKRFHEKLENIKKNNNYENIKMFFYINCSGVCRSEGIRKIREFTKREDAEMIYKNLRKEFIEKGLI